MPHVPGATRVLHLLQAAHIGNVACTKAMAVCPPEVVSSGVCGAGWACSPCIICGSLVTLDEFARNLRCSDASDCLVVTSKLHLLQTTLTGMLAPTVRIVMITIS